MPISRFEALPWDLTTPNTEVSPYGGTLVVENTAPWTDYHYDNIIARSKFAFFAGMQGRIRTLTIAGTVAVAPPEDFTGSFSIDMKPIKYIPTSAPPAVPWVEIEDERDLCAHGGWFGEGLDSEGNYCSARFGHKFYTPGFIDEIGRSSTDYSITVSPPTLFLFPSAIGDNNAINFGRTRLTDACPVVASFPAMANDGYGVSGFTLQLGGPTKDPFGFMIGAFSGAVTMTGTEWWEHDPEDGGGPVFNSATGARLRATPNF